MRGILLFLLLTIPQFLTAQRFYSVVFDQLPKDMQMYARDDDNLARIPISGKIEIPDWSHMSAVVYRNGTRYGYGEAGFDYKGGDTAQFQMEVAIEAEPADYTIEVWACRVPGEDSALIVTRNDIAAGDFYLITGQSNGAALQFDNWSSKYCRTIARIPDNNPATSPADTLWIPSSWSHPFTGAWGIHLQRLILENHQIPTTIINASIPGAKISHFVIRNDNNPADPNNLYGALLYRLNIAKPKRVRGFFGFKGSKKRLKIFLVTNLISINFTNTGWKILPVLKSFSFFRPTSFFQTLLPKSEIFNVVPNTFILRRIIFRPWVSHFRMIGFTTYSTDTRNWRDACFIS